MKISTLRHSRKGFTLVELIIAMVILGIMSTMTLMIYFNISETSRRLQISREISETARQITERISQDIRKNGVFIGTKETDTQWNDNSTANYLGDGNNVLHIRKVNPDGSQAVSHTYYYGKID